MRNRLSRLCCLLPILLLAACAAVPETRFFALANLSPATATGSDPASRLSVAVGPVDLPRYLDRPHIVSRSGDNRLRVDEFNRWGGSLEEEVGRVLGEYLGHRLGSQRVYSYPSRIAAETDYRIALDIRAFDGVLGGEVRLDVAWSLIADRSGEVLHVHHSVYRAAAAGEGYEGYVAAMSRALGDLGRELADALVGLTSPR